MCNMNFDLNSVITQLIKKFASMALHEGISITR